MRQTLAVLILLATTYLSAEPLHVAPFARDLGEARAILALEDGTVLVSRPRTFDVISLRDRDADGHADEIRTAVSSIEGAHGLAMRGRTLFVVGTTQIVAADRQPDGSFGAARAVLNDLPDSGMNPRRVISAGPDGKIYVAVAEHGALLQLDASGAGRRIHARGLRDLGGLSWHPQTGELWAVDGEELNRIGDGLNYEIEPAVARNAPSALAFDESGAVAFGVSCDSVVGIHFEDGKPGAVETVATIDGAKLTGVSRMFVSDERGSIYRLTSTPMTMTSSSASEPTRAILAKVFETPDLHGAEAVVHDEEQDVYLVSGTGFIARVSPEGRVLNREFIRGLNAPNGMAIHGSELWVADGTVVRVFDRVTGRAVRTIDLAPYGAVFLNDLATGIDDAVYVTDSDVRIKGNRERVREGHGRIFRIQRDGDVEVAIHGEELHSPTGIAWDGTRFLVAQAYGNEIVAWQPGHHVKAVLRGPGDFDGLTVLPNGMVIVASGHDDALHVGLAETTAGELKPLFAQSATPSGIAFDRKRNRLLIPSSVGGWLEGWTLPPMDAPVVTETKRAAAFAAAQ